MMKFAYEHPLVLSSQPELKIVKVMHGVTTVELSNGQIVRATVHIDRVTPNADQPETLDLKYRVTSEVLAKPEVPILDQHETMQ